MKKNNCLYESRDMLRNKKFFIVFIRINKPKSKYCSNLDIYKCEW